jgi:hypothetical protein
MPTVATKEIARLSFQMGVKHLRNGDTLKAERHYRHAFEAFSHVLGRDHFMSRHMLKRLKIVMGMNENTFAPSTAPTTWSADLKENGTSHPTKAPTNQDPYEGGGGDPTSKQKDSATGMPTSMPTNIGDSHFTFAPSEQPTQSPTDLIWLLDDPI